MGKILSNGSLMYRYKNLILRSPLTNVQLNPYQAYYYSVAGAYGKATASQVYLPTAGFHGPVTQSDCYAVGYTCNSRYNSPTSVYQVWRDTRVELQPETVFYQGTYATSARNPSGSSESYGQLCGYRFKLPDGLNVSSATLKYTLGGVVTCFGNPSAKSSKNAKSWSGTSMASWDMQMGVIGQLGTVSYIAQNAAGKQVDILAQTNASSGEAKGYRDLWGKLWDTSISGRDGSIPTLTTPSAQSVTLDANQLDAINRLRDFFIVPYYIAEVYSSTSYRPYFVPSSSNVGQWGCASLWGLSLKVNLE